MLNMERQREHFKDHVATYNDFGSIKVIDFKKPGSYNYRIRFIFEDDYCRLHISGDLGELIASNFDNMIFEEFGSDYGDDPGYFEEKVDCHSRDFYDYDIEDAKTDLHALISEFGIRDRIIDTKESWDEDTDDDEYIDEYIEECLDDFDDVRIGMGAKGIEKFNDVFTDFWEVARTIGRRRTGIIELYLLAYKLAIKQLKEKQIIK